MTHDKLVEKAANFLKYQKNCRAVLKEYYAATYGGETPDVIGWKSHQSYLIECKTSRSDFFKDKKKKFRKFGDNSGFYHKHGMGLFRYYFVPEGLIEPDEVPKNWGLVYLNGRSYSEIITADGSLYENPTVINRNKDDLEHYRTNERTVESLKNEISMLVSALDNK